jgi:hypothetical protein
MATQRLSHMKIIPQRRSYGWVIELVMAGLATAIILTLVANALA